jgi:hypothetical protein
MLTEDHQRAKRAFRESERLHQRAEIELFEQVVQQTCAELEVHARLEEELFYPAVRKVISEQALVDEAEIEHASVKALSAQIQTMAVEDPKFSATFKVLAEYVKHHIKEEESEMFERLNRSGIPWESLLQRMHERRLQLMQERGLMQPEAVAG